MQLIEKSLITKERNGVQILSPRPRMGSGPVGSGPFSFPQVPGNVGGYGENDPFPHYPAFHGGEAPEGAESGAESHNRAIGFPRRLGPVPVPFRVASRSGTGPAAWPLPVPQASGLALRHGRECPPRSLSTAGRGACVGVPRLVQPFPRRSRRGSAEDYSQHAPARVKPDVENNHSIPAGGSGRA